MPAAHFGVPAFLVFSFARLLLHPTLQRAQVALLRFVEAIAWRAGVRVFDERDQGRGVAWRGKLR